MLTINTKELTKALRLLKSGLPGRCTLPVLLDVQIKATAYSTTLTTNDLTTMTDIALTTCDESGEDWQRAVPVKELLDVVVKAGKADTVTLTPTGTVDLQVSIGAVTRTIYGHPMEELPLGPELTDETSRTFYGALLFADALKRAATASGADWTRQVLVGVLLDIEKDGATKCVATDTHRLHLAPVMGVTTATKQEKVLIKSENVNRIIAALAYANERDVCLTLGNNSHLKNAKLAKVETGYVTLHFTPNDDIFPAWQRVVPEGNGRIGVLVNAEEAAALALACVNKDEVKVLMALQRDTQTCTASGPNTGTTVTIPIAAYRGDDWPETYMVAVNGNYLASALRAVKGERAWVRFDEDVARFAPILITPEYEDGTLAVVMPMMKDAA
jgi:DNA polymerase III sliding clamp (beta) subunit (PCNA family)